jgi:hypothetical protein
MNSDEQCIENLILSFCMILLFLLRPKYNVFCSKNLQNDKVQHCLRHSIFFKNSLKYLCSNFVNFKEEEEKNKLLGARAPFEVFGFHLIIKTTWNHN